ncbi:uncharacterized protein [Typha latifolia]|uniref:uncharacterized protein n=1 Tax=Typha latifolia TaxID=4733 RepID=UPI003C2BDD06
MEGRSLGGRSLTTLSSTATTTTTNMWPQSMGKRLLIPSNTTTSTAATTTTTNTTNNDNSNSNSNSNCINNKKSNTMTQVSSPARGKERALECPRCNSSNTKFCYYNNYSLSQPRHFCKACKRYWTRGGTLRNVPVGGGCRKNKRAKKPAPIPSAATPPPVAPLLPPLSLPPLESSLNPLFFSSDMGFTFPLPPSSSSSPPPLPPPSSCANFDLQPSHLNSLSLGYHHLVSPLNNSDLVTTDPNLLQFEENANSGMIKLEAGDILASSNFGMGMSMGMGMGMGISSSTSIPLDPSFLYWNAPLF